MTRIVPILAAVALLASASSSFAASKQPKAAAPDNGGCTMKICVDNGVAMGHPLANAKRWCAEKMPNLYGPMCRMQ